MTEHRIQTSMNTSAKMNWKSLSVIVVCSDCYNGGELSTLFTLMLQLSDQKQLCAGTLLKDPYNHHVSNTIRSSPAEGLQNSLINHRNQRWKLGHLVHPSHSAPPQVCFLSALSSQLLNDSSDGLSTSSLGRLLHRPQ